MYLSKITLALEEACKRLLKECGDDISEISYRSQATFDQTTCALIIRTIFWYQKDSDISKMKVTLLNKIIELMLLLESILKRNLAVTESTFDRINIQADLDFLAHYINYIKCTSPVLNTRNLDNDREVISVASKYLVENSDIEDNNDDLILDYNALLFYGKVRRFLENDDEGYNNPWWLKVAMMRIERAVTKKESIPLRRVRKPKSPQTRYFRTRR